MHVLKNYASKAEHNFLKAKCHFAPKSVRYFLPTNFRQHDVLTPVNAV